MLEVPLGVKLVFLEVVASLLFVGVFLFNEDVAFVEASCPLAVNLPVPETQPAELIPAILAGHVHAPFILLDWDVAFGIGAGLGIQFDPSLGDVGVFSEDKVLPFPHGITRQWPMTFVTATGTEHIFTCAEDIFELLFVTCLIELYDL